MNATKEGIKAEERTVRWIEIAVAIGLAVVVPVASTFGTLVVANKLFAQRFVYVEQEISALKASDDKQDSRLSTILQGLADLRADVAEIKGRLSQWERPK